MLLRLPWQLWMRMWVRASTVPGTEQALDKCYFSPLWGLGDAGGGDTLQASLGLECR